MPDRVCESECVREKEREIKREREKERERTKGCSNVRIRGTPSTAKAAKRAAANAPRKPTGLLLFQGGEVTS